MARDYGEIRAIDGGHQYPMLRLRFPNIVVGKWWVNALVASCALA